MHKLSIIGIGTGNPEHLTLQAIRAMNAADVFFFPDKGEAKEDLLHFRRHLCELYIERPDYRIIEVPDPVRDPSISPYASRVEHWHEARASLYESLFQNLGDDQSGAFLVWGDPMLYDSTLRIVDRVLARGNTTFEIEVIPGITSIQALAAAHRIPIHGIGESVLITTGRNLATRLQVPTENLVVMLDGGCSFKNLDPEAHDIFWGAYLGTEQEILLSGPLNEAAPRIEQARAEARDRHGWIMDTYLIKPRSG